MPWSRRPTWPMRSPTGRVQQTGLGPADALTVYLIGEGTNQTLRLNETEYLDAKSLNGWLNAFLGSNEQAKINVIMDFSGSGRFLPGLAASNRVCIASCRPDQPAIWAAEGLVSFSRYFLSGLLWRGYSLRCLFKRGDGPLRRATRFDLSESAIG